MDGNDLTDFAGLFGDDMFFSCATNGSSTQSMPTAGELQQLMKKFPPRQPEVILLLEKHRAELRRLCDHPERPETISNSAMYGIPVEFFDTIEQLESAASEHIEAGRKVIRIDE